MLYLDCCLQCHICDESIAPGDPVIQAERYFHEECFEAGSCPELVPAFWEGGIY